MFISKKPGSSPGLSACIGVSIWMFEEWKCKNEKRRYRRYCAAGKACGELCICSVKTTLSVRSLGTIVLTPARWISPPSTERALKVEADLFCRKRKLILTWWSLLFRSLFNTQPGSVQGHARREKDLSGTVCASCRLQRHKPEIKERAFLWRFPLPAGWERICADSQNANTLLS